MRWNQGFSLLELLIAVTIAGILMGIGVVAFKPGRNAVNQAAQAVSAAVMQARFEAIKANRMAELQVDTSGGGSITLCVDEDGDGICSSDEVVSSTQFGAGDWGQVQLSATDLASNRVRFDLRGIPMEGVSGKSITLTERGATYSKSVVLTSTGRASVQ